MTILHYVADFFVGAFFCNAIPHLAAGVRGEPFPTPFAKPPGHGDSSPLVNFLWSFVNLLVALALYWWSPFLIGLNAALLVFLLGFLLMGISTSLHFGKVKADRPAR
jgi:hypothetical protein